MTYRSTLVLGLLSSSFFTHADVDSNDLFNMSFEQLLEVNVELASKTTETLASVPSTLTVFQQKQITSLGIDNIYELMNFVPGMQSTRGDWVGAVPKDHARGVYLDSGNILVMINGERINEASFGKASVYTPFIPVEIVEKVEFIRGPGSALYGSNAFLGVMNITTKQASNSVSANLGSYGRYGASINISKQFDSSKQLYFNASFIEKQGDDYPQGVKDPLQSLFIDTGIILHDLKLSARYDETDLNEFLNLGSYSDQNSYHSENLFAGIEYQWFNSDNASLVSSVSYTQHDIESAAMIYSPLATDPVSFDSFIGPAWQTKDIHFKTEYITPFYTDWQLVAGVEYLTSKQTKAGVVTSYYDYQQQDIIIDDAYYLGGPEVVADYPMFQGLLSQFETASVYAQVKMPLSKTINLFVGGRYDNVNDIDSKFSPRLAAIYTLNSDHTLKLQYGESFRTPVTNELYSNDTVTQGNPNLKAEYIKTTELVWHFKRPNWESNAVLFYNQLNDFINVVPTNTAQSQFTFSNNVNSDNSGLEYNHKLKLASDTHFLVTFTQYFQEPVNPSFKRFASMIIDHQFDNKWSINFNLLWRDGVTVTSLDGNQFEQSSYVLAGGSIQWQLLEDSSIQLKAENAFNKDYNVFDPRVENGSVTGATREISLHWRTQF